MLYVTGKGDVLDAICAKHYGIGAFDLRDIYDANIGLAAHGPVLPAGLQITLPEAALKSKEAPMIRLVD